MALRVLQLVGSATSETLAELSRLYARDCLTAIADPERYEPVIAHVSPGGRWQFPADLEPEALAHAPALDAPAAVAHIAALDIDVMVPQMFCLPGMTTYRALFDLLGIPYLGNRPEVMAMGSHKARAKAVVAAAGVAVPRGEVVGAGEPVSLTPPVVVKPVDADNSLGISLVTESAQLAPAVRRACAESEAALVEEYIPAGREVRCGIIVCDGEPICLPLEEYPVDASAHPIRDAADKLRRDPDGSLALVAKERSRAWIVADDDPVVAAVWAAAQHCHDALGCRHYSLFDFRVDPAGRPWFLEAGLYCSFARQSVITTMAGAAGIAAPELFALAIDSTLQRSPA